MDIARWARRNMRAFDKSAERNPWVHEYRRVAAEVERTGNDALFEEFERRFKQAMAERRGRQGRRWGRGLPHGDVLSDNKGLASGGGGKIGCKQVYPL